jgi:hypothetical protein
MPKAGDSDHAPELLLDGLHGQPQLPHHHQGLLVDVGPCHVAIEVKS